MDPNTLSNKFEIPEYQLTKQAEIIQQVREGEYEPELSDLQKEYMEKAAVRQKEGIVKPQVVAGRQFKGTSFISKPETILFKVSPLSGCSVHSAFLVGLILICCF